MVSNPYWCRSQSDFKELIYEWVNNPSGDNFMNIAIFYDALCVSGDIEIIKELKIIYLKYLQTLKVFIQILQEL